ncbi:MAG: HEAT repeat domain-containing protein [Synechococcaceae cyanobacterium ELA739]
MTLPIPLREHIRAVEQAASASDLLLATRALAGCLGEATDVAADASALEEAIATLVQVLGFNNPGAAVAAVDGLIALGSPAVEPLLSRLDPRNYGARAWAVRALAGIGDVRGLELLEEALATDVGPSVRRAAACGLGNLRLHTQSAAERLGIRSRALQALVAGRGDGEWVVRYAVAVGLETLVITMEPLPQEQVQAVEALAFLTRAEQEEAAVVRLRASMALERLRDSPPPS